MLTLFSCRKTKLNVLHIEIVLTYFTLVGKILSVQVEVVIFGMIEGDNNFKYELNTV